MCKCIYTWVEDPSVEGSHSSQAISCETYISELERELTRLSSADSAVIRPPQRAVGKVDPLGIVTIVTKEANLTQAPPEHLT